MELNKQIQLNHSIVEEGITIAVLSGSLSIGSSNVGNISTSILNREYYVKFKSKVQASIREFYNQFFTEIDEWDALLNTNAVEAVDEVIEEVVDDGTENDANVEGETGNIDPDTTKDTE